MKQLLRHFATCGGRRISAASVGVCVLFVTSAFAQPQAASSYIPPQNCTTDGTLPQGSERACEQIRDSLDRFSEEGQRLGERAGQIIEEVSNRTVNWGGQTFDRIAIENPLDANDGNEGAKAWKEYVHDSKLILNDTFIGCLEARKVVGHGEYNGLCKAICPRYVQVAPGCPECPIALGTPAVSIPATCRPQTHIVLEYYLPIYQIASNKAGARSLNVNMFQGRDNDPRLTRRGTSQHQENKDKQSVRQALEQAGIDTSELEFPRWHIPGQETYLQLNNESFDVVDATQSLQIGYQTNLHAQGTRNRPAEYWKGYDENPQSALWCFDDPTKKIVANAMDHGDGVYSLLARMAEFTQVVWPEAYDATVRIPWNLRRSGTLTRIPDGLEPSFRMAKWADPYGDLERLQMQAGAQDEQRFWIFYGGTLAPFNVSRFNSFSDPLRADLFRAATAAILFGTKRPAFSVPNEEKRRFRQFTRYTPQSRQGYTSTQQGIKDNVVFVDKLQLAYPPLEDGERRKGSPCFRPENIANNEPGAETELVKTALGHVAFPKDLRKQFLEKGIEELNRANETRVIVWEKRILCACQRCGKVHGCTTLNDGDFEEDLFAGNAQEFNRLPPPFKQLEPYLGGFAEREVPPQQGLPTTEIPPREVQNDDGKTGPIFGPRPIGSIFSLNTPVTPSLHGFGSGNPTPSKPRNQGKPRSTGPVNCSGAGVKGANAQELNNFFNGGGGNNVLTGAQGVSNAAAAAGGSSENTGNIDTAITQGKLGDQLGQQQAANNIAKELCEIAKDIGPKAAQQLQQNVNDALSGLGFSINVGGGGAYRVRSAAAVTQPSAARRGRLKRQTHRFE